MMVMIGYPDFLLKPEAIDKEYEARDTQGHPVWEMGPTSGLFEVQADQDGKILPQYNSR